MSGKDKRKAMDWTNEETNLMRMMNLALPAILNGVLWNNLQMKRSSKKFLKIFNSQLKQEEFIQHNQQNFGKNAYDILTLDTKKLQMNYNALKKKVAWKE